MQNQALCEQLIRADTEAEVEVMLKQAGYWDDMELWRAFGDNPANASVIGAQQEAAEAALVEKIVNSIDARLLDACRRAGTDPNRHTNLPATEMEAVSRWFDHGHPGVGREAQDAEVPRGGTALSCATSASGTRVLPMSRASRRCGSSCGVKFLDMEVGDGSWVSAENLMVGWHLSDETAEMRLKLPDGAGEGDIANCKFTVTDDNPATSDFVNTIELNVKPPHQPASSDTDPKKPKRRPPRADLPKLIQVDETEWFAASALAAAASGDGE